MNPSKPKVDFRYIDSIIARSREEIVKDILTVEDEVKLQQFMALDNATCLKMVREMMNMHKITNRHIVEILGVTVSHFMNTPHRLRDNHKRNLGAWYLNSISKPHLNAELIGFQKTLRIPYSMGQREFLNEYYYRNSNPSPSERQDIAERLNYMCTNTTRTEASVSRWFKNKRNKKNSTPEMSPDTSFSSSTPSFFDPYRS